ncbi:MAG: LamG domain-containing protein, partial [Deltaproteobacteria bacterium]|nr:LamG domain-containing protein [Deltaproteobacteria bacterium]
MPNPGQARGLAGWKWTFWLLGQVKTSMKATRTLFGIPAVTLALAMQVQAQSFLTKGLVAYYPLKGNANDASGNGHNGVPVNTFATTNQFGQASSALGFAGNGLVSIPYSTSLATTNFSVSLVLNAKAGFDTFCLLRSGGASSDFYHGYEIGPVDFQANFGFWDFDGTPSYGPGKCVTPIGNWKQNTWYYLTFTQSETNAHLFVNGVLVASATNTTPYVPAQSTPFYIGSNQGGNSFFTGIICDVRFYNRGLSAAEVQQSPFYIGSNQGGNSFFTGIICDVRFYNRGLSATEVQQLYTYESGPRVNLMKAIKPSFSNLMLNTNYQLQVSADGSTWYDQGMPFSATSTEMDYPSFYDVDDWNQLLFKLQVPAQPTNQLFLTNGLVAYYPFNGNANDTSGNGNNGTNSGVTFGTDRCNYPNSAGYFSGSSWIVVPYNTNLFQQTLSISFWLRFNDLPTALSAYEVAMQGGGGYESWHGFGFSTFNYYSEIGGPPMFGYWDVNGSGWSAQIGQPIASWVTNRWYQLVLVRTTTNAQLFIDNNLASAASGIKPIAVSTTSPLVIGAQIVRGSFSNGFRGA